jgi:hypothetical protein
LQGKLKLPIFVKKLKQMSSLEIKGTFIGMLAQIEDETLLRQMLEHCIEFAR